MKKFLAMLLFAGLMTACVGPEESGSDDGDRDGSNSSLSLTDKRYTMLNNALNDIDCRTADLDGDSSSDDSSASAFMFDESGKAYFAIAFFINDTNCDNDPDVIDIVGGGTHTVSGQNFDFNIVEYIRMVETTDGASALNSNSICGKTDWANGSEYDFFDNNFSCSFGSDQDSDDLTDLMQFSDSDSFTGLIRSYDLGGNHDAIEVAFGLNGTRPGNFDSDSSVFKYDDE